MFTMNNGWVAIPRRLLGTTIATNLNYLGLFAYLVLSANHKKGQVIVGHQIVDIERGQHLTSILKLARQFKKSTRTISTMLNLLENLKIVKTKRTTKYTIVTIENYGHAFRKEKQSKNKVKTKEKQTHTNNKNNNDNNILTKVNTEYGNSEINECIRYLENAIEMSLDGTKKSNRFMCKHLLNRVGKLNKTGKFTNVQVVKQVVDAGLADDFHCKNITNFGYIYRNMAKIISATRAVKKTRGIEL